MKKIMFDNHYGLEDAVLNSTKTMTRRLVATKGTHKLVEKMMNECDLNGVCRHLIEHYSRFQEGDVVAIAQRYWDLRECDAFYEALEKADPSFPLECIKGEKGCHNKMFVKAKWMPHQIRITDIKIERLQDISDEDCMNEGIYIDETKYFDVKGFKDGKAYCLDVTRKQTNTWFFPTPKRAFEGLIRKMYGKKVWDDNPYVFVYTFELIK